MLYIYIYYYISCIIYAYMLYTFLYIYTYKTSLNYIQYMQLIRTHFRFKDTHRPRVMGWKQQAKESRGAYIYIRKKRD